MLYRTVAIIMVFSACRTAKATPEAYYNPKTGHISFTNAEAANIITLELKWPHTFLPDYALTDASETVTVENQGWLLIFRSQNQDDTLPSAFNAGQVLPPPTAASELGFHFFVYPAEEHWFQPMHIAPEPSSFVAMSLSLASFVALKRWHVSRRLRRPQG